VAPGQLPDVLEVRRDSLELGPELLDGLLGSPVLVEELLQRIGVRQEVRHVLLEALDSRVDAPRPTVDEVEGLAQQLHVVFVDVAGAEFGRQRLDQ